MVLLTNGGGARELCAALYRELLAELAAVTIPQPFGPPAEPPVVALAPLVGTYGREGVVITVTEQDGTGHAVCEFVDGMEDSSEPLEIDLVPVRESARHSARTTCRWSSPAWRTARGASTSVCAADPRSRDAVRPRARDSWGNRSTRAPYAPTSRRLRSSCVSRRISSRAVPRCTAMTGGLPTRL